MPRAGDWKVRGLVLLWLVAALAGMGLLGRYSLIAGTPAVAGTQFPQADGVSHSCNRDALFMVVHPNCPCSRASMSELAVLAANCQKNVSITILFASAPGLHEDVKTTSLWRAASEISGATVIDDVDGAISHTLGAQTSGQVFLFDSSGKLRFSGGITDSRGHAGNNAGRSAIEAIVLNRSTDISTTPVFGCPLW